jgi:hypothetical protein
MAKSEIISESKLLDGIRRRWPVFADEIPQAAVTVEEVDSEFRTVRQKRSDIGLANHALNFFLEPRNPFEPGRVRKPKMEVTVFGTLLALVVIAVIAFNLAAPEP